MIIIPARMDSTRFPGKPLVRIDGKEMILWVCERCSRVAETWVATPDRQLYNFVLSRGFNAIMTGEHPTGTDRIAEAIQTLNDKNDIYVNVQGDIPLVEEADILNVMIEKKHHPKLVIGTMCRAEYNDKNTVKVVHNAGQLMYMTREGEARFRQCGLYGFNRKELEAFSRVPNKEEVQEKYENIEIMRFAEIGYPVKMIEVKGSPEVNEPDDICVVEWLIEEKRKEELQWNSKNLSNLNLLY